VILGRRLALPVASLAVGSDVMVYPDRMPALWRRLSDALAQVDLPIGVSASICMRLAETGRCRSEPVCVYLSRDTRLFRPAADKAPIRERLGWPTEGIVAIYVGGFVASKGIEELMEAVEPLLAEHADFRLVCAGEGPLRELLCQLANRVGRDHSVVLTGRVAPEEVPALLQASDFLVLPSHSEGMPQAVLEAMNCGLPVVATRVGGVPEAVVDGQTGLLVEAKDVGQLRAAIERMIRDEAFRRDAGRKGLARADEVFDSESNARKLADALRSLAEGSVAR
jgi:glycosyltransferase involved in cell wall biosynthesis